MWCSRDYNFNTHHHENKKNSCLKIIVGRAPNYVLSFILCVACFCKWSAGEDTQAWECTSARWTKEYNFHHFIDLGRSLKMAHNSDTLYGSPHLHISILTVYVPASVTLQSFLYHILSSCKSLCSLQASWNVSHSCPLTVCKHSQLLAAVTLVRSIHR